MNNQKGAAQLIVVIILLLGIASGIYLVGQRTNILPKAYMPSFNRAEVVNPERTQIESDNDLRRTLKDLEGLEVDNADDDITNWGKTTRSHESENESPVPSSTCTPRPACLDAKPRCLVAEPREGWCSSDQGSEQQNKREPEEGSGPLDF